MGKIDEIKTTSNSPMMGRIERMVAEMCPEGVKWVKLGDAMTICRGASPRPIQNYLTNDEDGVPWIKIGDVAPGSKYITKTAERITKEGATKSRLLKKGDFILSNSMSFGRPYILAIDGCIHDGWISMSNPKFDLSHDFLYHLLRCDFVQKYWILKANSGGAVSNLNADIVRDTPIPLPPLPIQEAIADILDKFDRLSAELQAELQARKQQYEYYRNQLLTRFAPEQQVTEYSLGDLGSLTRGRRFVRDDVRESGQPCIHYGDMYTYYGLHASEARTFLDRDFPKKMRYAEKGDVIIVGAGENDLDIGIGMVWEGEEPAAIHDACYILKHNINPRYIAHYLRTPFYHEQIRKYVNSAKICSISAENLAKAKILVPSLEEQARIVSILDKFEALVNDLSQGLPAEIAAVQEQYEYYRNRLLSF